MNSLLQDLRYALRGFVRAPGFTAIALLVLSLGIGANTAIFSVVNPILFRPLPFPKSNEVAAVIPVHHLTGHEGNLSYPDFVDLQGKVRSFVAMGAYTRGSSAVGAPEEPVRLQTNFATAGLFGAYGIKPLLGRTLEPTDDAPGASPVVLLAHWAWAKHFGSDPQVVGRSVLVDGKSCTVVGVMPKEFQLPGSRGPGIWLPLQMHGDAVNLNYMTNRGNQWLGAIARLSPGVSLDQARSELESISVELEKQYPDPAHVDIRFNLEGLDERVTKDSRPAAILLFSAVGLVLLIACANIANLLLARANSRRREMAIRLALGASRGRLIRQLLTESTLLSLVGAGVGLLLSLWMTDSLKTIGGKQIQQAEIDMTVIVFTVTLALLTGIIFGFVPAITTSNAGIYDALKESGTRSSLSRGRLRVQNLLIVGQIGLAFALLTSAGLMIKSLANLTAIDPGFEPNGLVAVRLPLPDSTYSVDRKREFYQQVLERIKSLPSVTASAGGDPFPFQDGNSRTSVEVEGFPPLPPGQALHPNMYEVSSEYFSAMGIPILEGRTFSDVERTSDRRKAIIINRKFAKRFWPNESPLGKRILKGRGDEGDNAFEIVGVVGDVRHGTLESDAPLQMYFPYEHSQWMSLMVLAKVSSSPKSLIPAIRAVIREADPQLPINEPRLVTEIIEDTTSDRRATMLLLGGFSLLALMLATIGLYGVVSYLVSQRSHEFAIRIALGAGAADVMRLILLKGLQVIVAGLSVGALLALASSRLLASLLYGVAAIDPLSYLAVALILGCAALFACYVPARRATRVDPLLVLRAE